jgi:hypothetical protein
MLVMALELFPGASPVRSKGTMVVGMAMGRMKVM